MSAAPQSSRSICYRTHVLTCALVWSCIGFAAARSAGADETSPAADQVTVLDSTGTYVSGIPGSFDAKGLVVDRRSLKTRDVVTLKFPNRPMKRSPTSTLLLLAGKQVVEFAPSRITDEFVEGNWIDSPEKNALRIPLELIRGIIFAPPSNAAAFSQLVDRIFEGAERHDSVVLKNGDLATGEFLGLAERQLTLKTAAGKSQIPLEGVRALLFNTELTTAVSPPKTGAWVGQTNGSRYWVTDFRRDPSDRFIVKPAWGGEWTIPFSALHSLYLVGWDATFLSDLEPAEYKFEPFFDLDWPLRRDRTVAGGWLSLKGTEYAKGLGMHSRSTATYRLDGRYRWFHAVLGVDDDAKGRGSVVFEVLVDGKQVSISGVVTGSSAPIDLGKVDVTGAKTLTLRVDYGPDGDILDHANWCDAVLVK